MKIKSTKISIINSVNKFLELCFGSLTGSVRFMVNVSPSRTFKFCFLLLEM